MRDRLADERYEQQFVIISDLQRTLLQFDDVIMKYGFNAGGEATPLPHTLQGILVEAIYAHVQCLDTNGPQLTIVAFSCLDA